jgi:predicted ester cyclase
LKVEPFVALMRRYCIDYTNVHDQSVCDEIMHPDYVVHITQFDLPRDALYKPAVTQVYQRFPGLGLAVHEFVTNGNRLAMRFSEHGASPADGGRLAAWGGIGLYKWDGKQLRENYVEQDFQAQQAQLSGEVETAPLEPPHLDPWLGTRAEPENPEAEAIVRDWLARGDLRDATEVILDGSWYEPLCPSPIAVEKVVINDLFSAGDRVAFHVSQTGGYTGGLRGVPEARRGSHARLDCAGLARIDDGRLVGVRAITDRQGAARGLLAGG